MELLKELTIQHIDFNYKPDYHYACKLAHDAGFYHNYEPNN